MHPILPLQGRITSLQGTAQTHNASQISFQDFLQSAQEKESAKGAEIAFSVHAQNRLQERNIFIRPTERKPTKNKKYWHPGDSLIGVPLHLA